MFCLTLWRDRGFRYFENKWRYLRMWEMVKEWLGRWAMVPAGPEFAWEAWEALVSSPSLSMVLIELARVQSMIMTLPLFYLR